MFEETTTCSISTNLIDYMSSVDTLFSEHTTCKKVGFNYVTTSCNTKFQGDGYLTFQAFSGSSCVDQGTLTNTYSIPTGVCVPNGNDATGAVPNLFNVAKVSVDALAQATYVTYSFFTDMGCSIPYSSAPVQVVYSASNGYCNDSGKKPGGETRHAAHHHRHNWPSLHRTPRCHNNGHPPTKPNPPHQRARRRPP
jgi:hypothetical protein